MAYWSSENSCDLCLTYRFLGREHVFYSSTYIYLGDIIMARARGSVEAMKQIVKYAGKIDIEEMASISEMAQSAGGNLIAIDPDGEGCGNGSIVLPWPPKEPDKFVRLLDSLVELWINSEVLINGIPVPDQIIIKVSRQLEWVHHHRHLGR
jgi:hypothetical protein